MTSLAGEIAKKAEEKIATLTAGLKNELAQLLLSQVQAALRETVPEEMTKDVCRQKVDPLVDCLMQWYEVRDDDLFDLLIVLLTDLVDAFPAGFSPGLSFTERMSGFFSEQTLPHRETSLACITNPFAIASKYGEANKEQGAMTAEFTVATDNLYTMLDDSAHQTTLTGTVTCLALSPHPMTVTDGSFQLLVVDSDRVETWTMIYCMELQKNDGTMVHCQGQKFLHQEPGSSPWSDLTTLYVTVSERQGGDVVGRGILKLGLDDLIRQGSTMRMMDEGGVLGKLQEKLEKFPWSLMWPSIKDRFAQMVDEVNLSFAAKFVGLFGTTVFRAYGGLLSNLKDFPSQDNETRVRRPLKAPTPEVHRFRTEDKVELQLTRYCGGENGPVILVPGFGVYASSFAADTTRTNIVKYLTDEEFDVWLFDYRASPLLTESVLPFTLDDIVQYDWPAATKYICDITGNSNLQAIVHCVGSMSFLMALLRDDQRAKEMRPRIRSVICSQLTLHPVTNWQNHLKSDIHLTHILEKVLHLSEVDLRSSSDTPAKAIDVGLWNVPVPQGEECKNPLCHRVFAVYGPPYIHAQLNELTHSALGGMFGKVHVKPFEQLSRIMQKEQVVDSEGRDTYLPNVANLKDLPIMFVAGGRNQLFYPETSALTLEWLRRNNPQAYAAGFYQRHIFPDYAHMDLFIGKNAADEIFPFLLKELQERG